MYADFAASRAAPRVNFANIRDRSSLKRAIFPMEPLLHLPID
jgi:hypothetical protein